MDYVCTTTGFTGTSDYSNSCTFTGALPFLLEFFFLFIVFVVTAILAHKLVCLFTK